MRPFRILDVQQGSPEWLQARCGNLTGTCAKDMVAATTTKGEAAARRNLRIKLVVERLTGQPHEDGYVSQDMKRGKELEGDAVGAYEAATGLAVARVGFIQRTDLPVGFSPDGIIGDFDGILEAKVPRSATHFGYLLRRTVPPEYAAQVTHGLFVTGADYCDFVSYDPRFNRELQLFRVRVNRNEFDLMTYERCVRAFLAEVDQAYEEALKLGALAVQTA